MAAESFVVVVITGAECTALGGCSESMNAYAAKTARMEKETTRDRVKPTPNALLDGREWAGIGLAGTPEGSRPCETIGDWGLRLSFCVAESGRRSDRNPMTSLVQAGVDLPTGK
jgi:hypothetical protein